MNNFHQKIEVENVMRILLKYNSKIRLGIQMIKRDPALFILVFK